MRQSTTQSKAPGTASAESPAHQAAVLRDEALRCRRLGRGLADQRFCETLLAMAEEYDAKAEALLRKPR